MSKTPEIIIVGAGLGGLAAAAGLLGQGVKVAVYERADDIGEIGAGIMLTPNAVHALRVVGALDAVMAIAESPRTSFARNGVTGEVVGSRPLAETFEAEYGMPLLTIHRADLHRALSQTVARLDPGCIRPGHAFVGYDQHSDRVTATFANGVRAEADAIIGADGIRSSVRDALGLASSPCYTGLVAWRGLAPIDRLPEHLRDTDTSVWSGDGHHFTDYTIGPLKNYVAIAEQSDWTSDSWSTPSSAADALTEFAGWHEDIATILNATPAGQIFKWALFDREPLDSWTTGRVTLLGDAAHPMLPLMAQGSAMALEDAAILTRVVAQSASMDDALHRYERARLDRTRWAQLQSRTARAHHQSVAKGQWIAETKKRADVLYTYDASQVAV